jgi:hypothetical protein
VPDPVLNTIMRSNTDILTFIDLLTETEKPKPKGFAEELLAIQNEALELADRASKTPHTSNPASDGTTALHAKGNKTPKIQPLGPNVTISTRRETQQARETEVGRWKVIKKELLNRGLPVYAHPRHVPVGEKWVASEELDRRL